MGYGMVEGLLSLQHPQLVAFVLGQVPTSLKIYIANKYIFESHLSQSI